MEKHKHSSATSLIDYSFPNESQILGITSEGGSGHLQLMHGIESRISAQGTPFIKADALKDTLPQWISRYCVSGWNKAKIEGDIETQEFLVKGTLLGINRHRLADLLFFLPIFLWTVRKLIKHKDITLIIDTQPIGIKAIIRATRLVNYLLKRNIRITKVLTEIATPYTCSVIDPAKSLSVQDKKIFSLTGPCPFIKKPKETEEAFIHRQEKWWNHYYHLSLLKKEVQYSHYPLRAAYQPFIKTNRRDTILSLKVKINHKDEIIDPKAPLTPFHEFTIDPQEVIGMISIGSQVTREATKTYVKMIIDAVSATPSFKKSLKLFIAAGSNQPGENSFYNELKKFIATQKIPSNLTLIPMGLQEDTLFAPLMHRADFGIFGSGGMTTMELAATATGKLFLHSEAKRLEHKRKKKVKREEGLALWEKGNALHLVKTKGAKIVVPDETFFCEIKNFLVVIEMTERSPSKKQHADAKKKI